MMMQRLENLTAKQLILEYNSYGPTMLLAEWNGGHDELISLVRTARKQATGFGIVQCVTVTLPK